MRDCHDVTSTFIGLKNIENLPNAGPKQLGPGLALEQRQALPHEGHWIATRVGDASAKNRHNRRHCRIQDPGHAPNLLGRENCGNIQLDPLPGQFADKRQR